LSFLSVADLSTQPRLLSWYRGPCLTGRRPSQHFLTFGCIGIRFHSFRFHTLWSAHRHSSDRPSFRDWQRLPAGVRPSQLCLGEDWWRTSAPPVFKPEFRLVHENTKIQINVQKKQKSYDQNSSTVLQFSSVQMITFLFFWTLIWI